MLHHTAEIVAVGTELLLGSIANTNAQYLSQELNALGIGVCYHTVVGDNPERLRKVLAIARERADIVITTGGLGPTYDDLTKTVVAEKLRPEARLPPGDRGRHPPLLRDLHACPHDGE